MAQDASQIPISERAVVSNNAAFIALAIPVSAILVGHFLVDVYSSIVPSLLGVVETKYVMNPFASAMLLGVGSVCSGLAQPLFAWLSDRWNTRIFGALGMLMGALGICFIGFAPSSVVVFIMYAFGMAGIGMFHPIAASSIGKLTGDKKGIAISWFFVFGMAGVFCGSLLGPSLAAGSNGMLTNLIYLVLPGVLFAFCLQFCIGKLDHKAVMTSAKPAVFEEYHWVSIGLLYVAAATRFLVNLSLVYLLLRWLEADVALQHPGWTSREVSDFASPLLGRLNATLTVGMAVGGLTAGSLIGLGKERLPLVVVPIVFSPAIMALGFLSPGIAGYAVCFLAGVGFAAMVPVTVSLAQRLMPGHTSLASGMMLGGAWSIACVGPALAQLMIQAFGLGTAFVCVGGLLAFSGLIAIGLDDRTIRVKD